MIRVAPCTWNTNSILAYSLRQLGMMSSLVKMLSLRVLDGQDLQMKSHLKKSYTMNYKTPLYN